MECPYCNGSSTSVADTRNSPQGARRRRRCQSTTCGAVFWTVERLDVTDSDKNLRVRKRDGTIVPFELNRIRNDIREALDRKPPESVLDEVIDAVLVKVGESAYRKKQKDGIIAVDEIGYIVLGELRKSRQIYAVSRIRFALGLRSVRPPTNSGEHTEPARGFRGLQS
jgi:transcriptional repressor NrdR